MKINVKITKKGLGFFESDKEIVDIDICNGAWKYWDCYMETNEKVPITINTITKAHFLHYPVKDAFPHHDMDLYKETGEIKVVDASIRVYENLLSFLNCRIDNVKQDYKKGTYKLLDYDKKGGVTFYATLFDYDIRRSEETVINDIIFENEGLIEVKIKVIE